MRVSWTSHAAARAAPYRDRVGPSISLDLTVDDVIAYSLHVLKTSEASRAQVRRAQLLLGSMGLLLLVLSLVEVALRMEGALVWVAGCIALLALVVLLPRLSAWGAPRRIRRIFSSGVVAAPTAARLWVDDFGGIVEQQPDRTTSYAPFAITNIEETPDHVFVTMGPGSALIIPLRAGAPDVQAFVQALTWHRAQRGIV